MDHFSIWSGTDKELHGDRRFGKCSGVYMDDKGALAPIVLTR